MRFIIFLLLNFLFFCQTAFTHPYWDSHKVPKDINYAHSKSLLPNINHYKIVNDSDAIDLLRIQVNWQETKDDYYVSKMIIEPSGTPALLSRSKVKPRFGSYLGILRDNKTGDAIYYDSIGTGKEYRKLTRAINLRFPVPVENMTFELYAENPVSGEMEKVASQAIILSQLQKSKQHYEDLEVRELALARKLPSLRINIYADGYLNNEKEIFWQHALKTVQVLQSEKFPGIEYMSFYGVFHASNKKLGKPTNLGKPVPEYDSFLGLYYPYWWDTSSRWYDTVYPTQEDKFRQGLAAAPYDYPIILINSPDYWGVGNYMSLTAIPAANSMNFTYLLVHELGHFFGLNEEYEEGGRTDLEFATDIAEPWSQNITFLIDTRYENLKWKAFVDSNIPLPTPWHHWRSSPPVYGAYEGGYAGSKSSRGSSHKPGQHCVMKINSEFCDICSHAIRDVIQHSLGM